MRKCISKAAALVTAMAVAATSGVLAFAKSDTTDIVIDSGVKMYDKDGDLVATASVSGSTITADVEFDKTLYISLDDLLGHYEHNDGWDLSALTDKDNTTLKVKKTTGSKYISKVEMVGEKKLDGHSSRGNYLRLTTQNNYTTDEEKVEFDVTFTAKKDHKWASGVMDGDTYEASVRLWISNPELGEDIETGERGIYNPEDSDTNEITWSDSNSEVAYLEFNTDSDSEKFFVELSTKGIDVIWEDYADPIGAELLFRDFKGHPKVPATSRATLRLYNTEDSNGDVFIDHPEAAYIYEYANGELVDVTSNWKWNADEEGWESRVRVLGSYVISDKELIPEETYVPGEDLTPEGGNNNNGSSNGNEVGGTTIGGNKTPANTGRYI